MLLYVRSVRERSKTLIIQTENKKKDLIKVICCICDRVIHLLELNLKIRRTQRLEGEFFFHLHCETRGYTISIL